MNKKFKPKAVSEAQSRKNLLDFAKKLGCDYEVKKIFNKYDDLLKNCTNKEERDQIATLGLVEIHNLFGMTGSLEVNNKEIIPAKQKDDNGKI